ncbi:MAG: class 1 fructose-bisphosphatase [Planctomycetota bacterium]|jgi:fructose-1,6-bisphosphatase I
MRSRLGTTLSKHLISQQARYPEARGELSGLLSGIITAGRFISRMVNKAGLADVLGLTGDVNVQGEAVKKLDEYANEVMKEYLSHTGHLCAITSEEEEGLVHVPKEYPTGNYVLSMDPLDGSSNIDANVSIGTIFSIHKKISPGRGGVEADFLQPGRKQVAAGYILYGSSTMLVFSTGDGVNGFTLDPGIGEFLLSHPDIKTPDRAKIVSTNMGYYTSWSSGMRKYIDYLREEDKETGRPYSSRYIGSLVSDFHRNLLYGGIFLYPPDSKSPQGKLRLLYEAAPLSYIIEQAGGLGSTGAERILDIEPIELHQRCPLVIGCKSDVELAEKYLKEG